jgi:hypothetical protein
MEKNIMNKLKVDKVELNDEEFFNQVRITESGKYLIDGEIVEVDYHEKKFPVKNINNIKKITLTTYIRYYTNREDENKILTIDEYNNKKQELLLKSEYIEDQYDSENDYRKWNTIEDEFEYKKFIRDWIPVKNTIQEISEPIKVEVIEHNIKNDNPFIQNYFLNGKDKFNVYQYNRISAVKNIIRNKFKKLGMKFIENINYQNTNKKMVWGNSTHSGVRYLVAFGNYIFKDDNVREYENNIIGNYETLKNRYNEDKKYLENYIQKRYDLHFKEKIKIDFEHVYKRLNTIHSSILELNVYKINEIDKSVVLNIINDLIKYIENGESNEK